MKCGTWDIPIKPSSVIENAWTTCCKCGWGATGDAPESTVIALAHHLEDYADD